MLLKQFYGDKKFGNLEYSSNIDISNIKAGDRYFNYQELCDALNLDASQRKNKDKVLKEFSRLVKYIKVGRAFVIKEVYRVPMHIEAQGKYQEYLQVLIRSLLAQTDDLTIEATYKQLFTSLGITNSNFCNYLFLNKERYYLNAVSFKDTDFKLSKELFSDFKTKVSWLLKRKLKSTLDYMIRQGSITYKPIKWVCIKRDDETCEGDGRDGQKSQYEHRPLTEEEIKKYTDAENYVLSKYFEGATIDKIFATQKYNKFLTEIKKYVNERYHWEYVYDKIRIEYNTEGTNVTKASIKWMLQNEAAKYDIESMANEFKEKITDMLMKYVSVRHNTALQAYSQINAKMDYNDVYEEWGELRWDKQIQIAYTNKNVLSIWKILLDEYFSSVNKNLVPNTATASTECIAIDKRTDNQNIPIELDILDLEF